MIIKLKDSRDFNEMLLINGHSQRSFARKIEISEPYMNQIATGERNPGPKTAKKICEGLGAEFGAIFFIDRDNKSYQKHSNPA